MRAKSEELIELNSPRLGYDDPQMLHPGDVVYLEDEASTANASVEQDAGANVAGVNDSVPTTVAGPTASSKPATTGSSIPWTTPLASSHGPAHRQTPTSPPLSEVALINSTPTNSVASGTPRRDPLHELTSKRTELSVVAGRAQATTPANVSAS